jgi:hypothetical protein
MERLHLIPLLLAGVVALGCADRAAEKRGQTPPPSAPPSASALGGQLRFMLRGRELELAYTGPMRSGAGLALHDERLRYSCATSLWASLGQDEPPGAGLARAASMRPFAKGASRHTVRLDRDIGRDVGACVVESVRGRVRSDIAAGLFVTPTEFVRRDAPGPPELSARPDERRLAGPLSRPDVALFLGRDHLRIVLTDRAPVSIQRAFRTQPLSASCFGPEESRAGQALVVVRFPPRSREAVARFRTPVGAARRIVCGVEAGDTGMNVYGSLD